MNAFIISAISMHNRNTNTILDTIRELQYHNSAFIISDENEKFEIYKIYFIPCIIYHLFFFVCFFLFFKFSTFSK